MKLAKPTDHLISFPTQRAVYKNEDGYPDTLPSSPSTSVPSFTSLAGTAHDDLKVDGHASYRQSPLSRQVSRSLDKSPDGMDSNSLSRKSHSQRDPANLVSDVNQGQFHFSIYKWAGKGVKLVAPSKTNLQHENRFKRLPEIVVQEVDVILHADIISTPNTACETQSENLYKPVTDVIVETKSDADSTMEKNIFLNEFGSKFVHGNETEESDISNSNSENVPTTISDAQQHDLKKLEQLFDDHCDKKQNKEISRQVEETEDYLRRQENAHSNINSKQQPARENKRDLPKAASPTIRDAALSSEEKMRGSRVKGKVKDFIKIFSQEGSPKRKGIFETPVRRPRGKDDAKGKVEDLANIPTANADEPAKISSATCSSTLSETHVPIHRSSDLADKVNFKINIDVHMIDDSLFKRKDPLRPHSDSTPDIVDASASNAEESNYEDLEGYLVEPLSPHQNKDLKSSPDQDQIKEIDSKIRNWSKGKEENIRSLLSTLQYVLWPESGWKPIPLVDIIEGSAVKRAYQKALLRLHPDKLQQKGAADHERYIAAKVFDIMQDAWDHFNSITQVYWHGDD